MNRNKCHVKKGDHVEVISGNFRGSSGRILAVFPQKQRVLVEGVRIIKKHLRKSQGEKGQNQGLDDSLLKWKTNFIAITKTR